MEKFFIIITDPEGSYFEETEEWAEACQIVIDNSSIVYANSEFEFAKIIKGKIICTS